MSLQSENNEYGLPPLFEMVFFNSVIFEEILKHVPCADIYLIGRAVPKLKENLYHFVKHHVTDGLFISSSSSFDSYRELHPQISHIRTIKYALLKPIYLKFANLVAIAEFTNISCNLEELLPALTKMSNITDLSFEKCTFNGIFAQTEFVHNRIKTLDIIRCTYSGRPKLPLAPFAKFFPNVEALTLAGQMVVGSRKRDSAKSFTWNIRELVFCYLHEAPNYEAWSPRSDWPNLILPNLREIEFNGIDFNGFLFIKLRLIEFLTDHSNKLEHLTLRCVEKNDILRNMGNFGNIKFPHLRSFSSNIFYLLPFQAENVPSSNWNEEIKNMPRTPRYYNITLRHFIALLDISSDSSSE